MAPIKIFSRRTLDTFEDASASIPLRVIDRVFDDACIRMGADPGGLDGARRVQFRRYVAGVTQDDPQQLNRLGDALGALIEEVATSKQAFLVRAAEQDGFVFSGGVFRPMEAASFAIMSAEDLASIDEHGRRLHFLADDSPTVAIRGAVLVVDSVCRVILRISGANGNKTADLHNIVHETFEVLEVSLTADDLDVSTAGVRSCLDRFSSVVNDLAKTQRTAASCRHARLVVGAAIALAAYLAETYLERVASTSA